MEKGREKPFRTLESQFLMSEGHRPTARNIALFRHLLSVNTAESAHFARILPDGRLVMDGYIFAGALSICPDIIARRPVGIVDRYG